MSVGSVLVGVALALVVVACLAWPFRTARAGTDLDRAIEAWVARVRAEGDRGQGGQGAGERVAYCHRCGRRVGPDDAFCAGCGAPLQRVAG